METAERLQSYIKEYGERYPDCWSMLEMFRRDRGVAPLPDWPDWCWCPLAGATAIIGLHVNEQRLSPQHAFDIGPLGALATWRMTRGIYRYDSDLFHELWHTPIEGDLPIDVLYRLPEWCVFVEPPRGADCQWFGAPVVGWFAHLEWDVQAKRPELRLVFDTLVGLIPFAVHLKQASLSECVQAAIEVALKSAEQIGADHIKPVLTEHNYAVDLMPYISVTLYLCAEAADISDLKGRKERPQNPQPVKTKKGLRTFPADNPTSWQVGYRIGAALRRAYYAAEPAPAGEGAASEKIKERSSPRPHIRRAHWHSYWTGPRKGKREAILKWLPPIPVGAGELVPTIHLVEKEKAPAD